jgi:hypothetical protein
MSAKVQEEFISADNWMPLFVDILKKGHRLKISPHGYSMYPFLIGDRDEVVLKIPNKELKTGDVVLYRRSNGLHVLHRIHHINEKGYYMIGDSQTEVEGPLKRDQIIAIAETLIRKGKEIPCHNKKYRVLFKVWMKLKILRPVIIKTWLKLRKISYY